MPKTAQTAKTLPPAERKARVTRLVKSGKVPKKAGELIDYREPSKAAAEFGKSL